MIPADATAVERAFSSELDPPEHPVARPRANASGVVTIGRVRSPISPRRAAAEVSTGLSDRFAIEQARATAGYRDLDRNDEARIRRETDREIARLRPRAEADNPLGFTTSSILRLADEPARPRRLR